MVVGIVAAGVIADGTADGTDAAAGMAVVGVVAGTAPAGDSTVAVWSSAGVAAWFGVTAHGAGAGVARTSVDVFGIAVASEIIAL